MSTTSIGLKLANGEFYPVLEDGVAARKRLVVTTVQDEQRSVQIDLYRGSGKTVHGSEYIGSLVVDSIPAAPRGAPDIRLELGLDAEGNLAATVEDSATGERRSLNVSLQALAEEQKYEIPDFEFEEETDELPREASRLPGEGLFEAGEEEAEVLERKPKSWLRIALVAFAALLVALLFAFIVYRVTLSAKGAALVSDAPESAAPAPTPAPTPAPAPPAAVQEAPKPVVEVPAPAPVAETPPPAPKPAAAPPPAAPAKAGVYHRIKWGDTLWDLSYAYYRNPWLYPRIAKANGIKNPDLIISGTRILIPPR